LAEDGCLRISVTDTGIGMAAHDIPKAMSTFGQVDGALDRRFEGTGLGLPLVKSLAELHGGGLEIDSLIGVGTKATIWFPPERVVGDG
jgi:two-component system cell cycle sensor histidine kinase PleC